MSTIQALASNAMVAFTGDRWAITEAIAHVPPKPGLYAIFGDETAWRDLDLTADPGQPLYIGKAEDSLIARDLNGHFGANPNLKPQTGSSTVRRSFAALLRETLELRAVPRNLQSPGYFTSYGLAHGGDERLSAWMHARLTLAVWPAPKDISIPLSTIETEVIRLLTPPINISKNPRKLARLSRARERMADDAARWTP